MNLHERREVYDFAGLAIKRAKREEARAELLANAIRHVLRHGKLGKQSEARLRAALRAAEIAAAPEPWDGSGQ